jgi:hypothetical protein
VNFAAMMTVALALLPVALAGPLLYLGIPTKAKRSNGFVFGALIIFLNAAAVIIMLCEIFFTATVYPLFNCIVVFVLACVCIAVFRQHRTPVALWLGGVSVGVFLVLAFVDFTPVKPYQRFYNAVQNGMTHTEVMNTLHRQFPANGRFPVPVLSGHDTNGMSFFLDPAQGAYNAEGVFLSLSNGRVTAKVYSPD